MTTFVLIALGINVGIALLVNHWEGAWEVVSLIFAILYNLVNIIVMTIMMRTAIDQCCIVNNVVISSFHTIIPLLRTVYVGLLCILYFCM